MTLVAKKKEKVARIIILVLQKRKKKKAYVFLDCCPSGNYGNVIFLFILPLLLHTKRASASACNATDIYYFASLAGCESACSFLLAFFSQLPIFLVWTYLVVS